MANQERVSLSSLAPAKGSKQRRKRLGFGSGSGLGKTSGKGHKGQTARSGGAIPRGFEGGQMPLHRRLPKRGFTSRMRVRGQNIFSVISLQEIAGLGEKEVTVEMMRERGIVGKRPKRVKVLTGRMPGGIVLDKALVIEVDAISAAAKAAVEKAGGTVRLR